MSKTKYCPSSAPVLPIPDESAHRCKQESELQAILDTAVEGIIVINAGGTITTFNRAAGRMFGYEIQEIIGKKVTLLMPDPFRMEHQEYIQSYLRTGKARIIGIGREAVGLRKDGTVFPIELAVSEVKHAGVRSFAGIVRDISHRKRMEKAVLDVSELEQRRIGKELHDGLCQELAGIALLVKTLAGGVGKVSDSNRQTAGDASVLLQSAVQHARALARGLQPVDLLPEGLVAALGNLARDTSSGFGVACELRCRKPVHVHDSARATHLYRIAQECVRNAVDHGRASRVTLDLVHKHCGVELSVSDDGAREGAAFGDEMVYEMLHHRANVIGGRILVRERHGQGIRVTCQVPDVDSD